MKRIILLTTVSLFTLLSQAQITKGSVLLGGGIFLSDMKSDDPAYYHNNRLQWGIAPSVGKAVKENLIYGITLSYNNWKDRDPNYSGKQINDNYGGGLFLRKYLPLGKGFYLFGEPGLDFFYGKHTIYQNETDYSVTKNWNVYLNFDPGISYAVSRKFHLEAGLGNLVSISYGRSKTEYSYLNTSYPPSHGSGFSLSSSLSTTTQLFVGLKFLLAK